MGGGPGFNQNDKSVSEYASSAILFFPYHVTFPSLFLIYLLNLLLNVQPILKEKPFCALDIVTLDLIYWSVSDNVIESLTTGTS